MTRNRNRIFKFGVVKFVVGFQAQITKGRTGPAWALGTFNSLSFLAYVFWPDYVTVAAMMPVNVKAI